MITYNRESWTPEFVVELMMLVNSHNDETFSTLGEADLNLVAYFTMDINGTLDTFVAREDGKMVGYLVTITTNHLHHKDVIICVQDAFFVSKSHRNGRVGIKLIKFCEDYVKDYDVDYLCMSCSESKDLSKFYGRLGYEPMDRTFFKKIGG